MTGKCCVRCRHFLPLDWYGWNGNGNLCANCRLGPPMTAEERRESHRQCKARWREKVAA